MMGVSPATLAELPSADDGDTNNLRRRALWALEGKRDDGNQVNYAGGYNKVEIPELLSRPENSIENDRRPQMNSALVKRDSLGRERDSYGRVISQALSLKDQLHTLLEEDEEEEVSPLVKPPGKQSTHSSPNISESSSQPASTPAATMNRNRLKPLTLSTVSPLVSLGGLPTSRSPAPSLSELAAKRRSSLSYRRSEDVNSSVSVSASSNSLQFIRCALPTPESTPTTSERPLSPSEQAFLFNNQASLLARISELERVLASRTRTRPLSTVSTSSRQLSTSSIGSEFQSEEMLRLIQDLKTERDELSRDLGLAQSKAENLENQIVTVNRRVEKERQEAWLVKQSEQALKIENNSLHNELDAANVQIIRLREDLERVQEEWRSRTQQLAAKAHGSDNSHAHRKDVSLPYSVQERGIFPDDTTQIEEDELAHYEDEDVGDVSFYSDQDDSTSSTFFYEHRQDNLTPPTVPGRLMPSPSSVDSISPPPTPLSAPGAPHKRSSSLEQGWSFPKGAVTLKTEPPQVDRFFECLEIPDNDDLTSFEMAVKNVEVGDKYGFFSGEQDEDEDDFPFVLPSHPFQPTKSDITIGRANSQFIKTSPPSSPFVNDLFRCNRIAPKTQECSSPQRIIPSLHMSTMRPAPTPPPAEPSTPQSTRSSVGRHIGPSLIPKLSPAHNVPGATYLATPTSVPRVKISPVSPQSATKAGSRREMIAKSPTKLPQLRMASANTHSSKLFALELMVRRKRNEWTAKREKEIQ